jgi:hypothetical protein
MYLLNPPQYTTRCQTCSTFDSRGEFPDTSGFRNEGFYEQGGPLRFNFLRSDE